MSQFSVMEINANTINSLKEWLENQNSVFAVGSDDNSSLLICYSLLREMGGPNDELAQFIYDDEKRRPVEPKSLQAEIGTFEGSHCIRIFSRNSSKISISIPLLQEIIICRGEDIIISPRSISSKIKSNGLTPVVVRDWLKRAIFSDFDPKTMSYRDQLWVLRNNEVLLYADLVASQKVIFQDMHDITAHIAGLNDTGYEFAGTVAARVHKKLNEYFGLAGRGNLTSHLVPFLVGVILDGLTQSMIYGSESRRLAIDELLNSMDELKISPQSKLRLNGFPKGIDTINGLLRDQGAFSLNRLKSEIKLLLDECVKLTTEFSTTNLKGITQ